MYNSGRGVPQDYAMAASWFLLAAEQGNPGGQSSLGSLYFSGNGVPQDYVEAHMWFNLAAAGRGGALHDFHAEARDAVAERMTAEQVAEAQRRAREWTPTPEP